uniref:Large ribosomal subunit protein uL14 n=1 Tax=Parascaris univalens TaxID=6257 RepID=A0A915A8I9_PARUN
MLSSLSSALSRLSIAVPSLLYISRMSASGRWWPQPQPYSNAIRKLTGATNGSANQSCSKNNAAVNMSASIVKSTSDTAVQSSTEPIDSAIKLFRDKAAPIFATPRGPNKKVYKTVEGKNGELLADYVLFEDSINKAKVTWDEYSSLTSEERDIYMAHLKALRERKLSYKDPKTGFHVMCLSQLLLNGKCCGNGCRHCPYEHEAAK